MEDDETRHISETPPNGLKAGETVFEGRYLLQQQLGLGGMGEVWRALDQELGVTVALKFLSPLFATDPDAYDLLRDETLKTRKLSHPNIVRTHHLEKSADRVALSMDYLPGGCLREARAAQFTRCFDLEPLYGWLAEAVVGLTHAHEVGIIHRDIKPANLLLDRAFAPKEVSHLQITDFGIAMTMESSLTGRGGRSALRRAGTPLYMSPQQSEGRRPAKTDDVYSFAATVYHLVTSSAPYSASQLRDRPPEPMQLRRQERLHDVPAAVRAMSDIPKAWEEVIAASLAEEPENRPQSMREVGERMGLERKATKPEERSNKAESKSKESADSEKEEEASSGGARNQSIHMRDNHGTFNANHYHDGRRR